MHRVYGIGASPTPPVAPTSVTNPDHYPSYATKFEPYSAYVLFEEICNVVESTGAELDLEATNQLLTAIDNKISAAGVGDPVGTGKDFWGVTLPAGYLWGNGATHLIADYPALFAVFGTRYGGNGTTTFGVPDKRDRQSIGKGDMGGAAAANRVTDTQSDVLGGVGGTENKTLVEANLPPHDHGIPTTSGYTSSGSVITKAGGSASSTVNTNNAGSGTAFSTMDPWIACNYIIKY